MSSSLESNNILVVSSIKVYATVFNSHIGETPALLQTYTGTVIPPDVPSFSSSRGAC